MVIRDSTFTSNRGGPVLFTVVDQDATYTRLTFRDNIGGPKFPGADLCVHTTDTTVSECDFSNSRGGTEDGKQSGAMMVRGGAYLRVLDSAFEDTNSPNGDGGAVAVIEGSTAEFFRTTFERSEAPQAGGIAAIKEESYVLFDQCVLREGHAPRSGGIYNTQSIVNITRSTFAYNIAISGWGGAIGTYGDVFIQDSTFEHNEATTYGGDVLVSGGAHVEVVRTVFKGARAATYGGSISAEGGGSSTRLTDSTFLGAQAVASSGGLARLSLGSRAEFVRCSVSATTSPTSVFQLDDPGSSLSILDSVIANITQGTVIIDDTTGDEFATQLDLVTFDASNTIPALRSVSTMLVQSCDGLEPSDVSDASVGVCATTTQFCMSAACDDATVGIDCFCFLDGVTPTTEPLPAGCMNSGELAMTVPSSLELRLDVEKPGNATQEARAARIKTERAPVACTSDHPPHTHPRLPRADGARQHRLRAA